MTGLMWIAAVLLAIAAAASLKELAHWWLWRRTVRRWRKDADEAMNGAYRREQARRREDA